MALNKNGSHRNAQIVADLPLPRNIESQLADRLEIISWSDALAGKARDAVGIYTYMHPIVDAKFLDCVPAVKTISNHGVGIDHIDLKEAHLRGVEVTTTPGTLEVSVAELAMGLMLSSARKIPDLVSNTQSSHAANLNSNFMFGTELYGKTLGILGMGKIGLQIAIRAACFGMKIIYHNTGPRLSSDFAEMSVLPRYVILEELLSSSDVLMICAPLNEFTRGIMGREQLSLMKPNATLVNVARGQLVDTEALADAIEAGQIASAALDVTEPEPLPADHRLLKMLRVYITPHVGSATVEARRRMAQVSVENLFNGIESNRTVFQSI